MMSASPPDLDQIVESICALGCSKVNAFIADIEAGQRRDELRSMTSQQRQQVLRELKNVMQVYQRQCDA